jgi:CBS domain-containing protein
MTSLPRITVREVMTGDPVEIDGMASLGEALKLMAERNISALVVRRRDERDEYGLLLVSDVAQEIISKGRPSSRTNVYEVMQKPAPAVDAEMDIRYAIRQMSRFGLTHCLVVEARQLAGIVTLRDLTMRYITTAESASGEA